MAAGTGSSIPGTVPRGNTWVCDGGGGSGQNTAPRVEEERILVAGDVRLSLSTLLHCHFR